MGNDAATTGGIKKSTDGSKKLKEFVEYSNAFKVFSQREAEVEQLMFAILTKEHVLLKGLPGSAKSMLAMKFLGNIKGAKIFKQQFTAFMDESYIFGPQLIEELKKGNIIHNTVNSLVDCNFGFLDEFFNANEETIISCNEVLNERTFTRNMQKEESSLITAIMTTNQDREGEKKLKAIYDRIMFSSQVLRVEGESDRMQMYINALKNKLDVKVSFSLEDIKDIHNFIAESQVTFYPGIIECFDLLIFEFQQQANVYISDRRCIKALRFLKVVALVKGRDTVEFEDLNKLRLVLFTNNDARMMSIFDASLTKTKKEYSRIEKETKFIRQSEEQYKSILDVYNNAIGYRDYKAIKNTVESFIREANLVIADVEDISTKERLTSIVEDSQRMLAEVNNQIKIFESKGDSAGLDKDAFDFLQNLSKDGDAISEDDKDSSEEKKDEDD